MSAAENDSLVKLMTDFSDHPSRTLNRLYDLMVDENGAGFEKDRDEVMDSLETYYDGAVSRALKRGLLGTYWKSSSSGEMKTLYVTTKGVRWMDEHVDGFVYQLWKTIELSQVGNRYEVTPLVYDKRGDEAISGTYEGVHVPHYVPHSSVFEGSLPVIERKANHVFMVRIRDDYIQVFGTIHERNA